MYWPTAAVVNALARVTSIFSRPFDPPDDPCGPLGHMYAVWAEVETGCWTSVSSKPYLLTLDATRETFSRISY